MRSSFGGHRPPLQLEGKAETKVERAERFARTAIGIDPVIDPKRAHRKRITQTQTHGKAQIVEARILRAREQIPCVAEDGQF